MWKRVGRESARPGRRALGAWLGCLAALALGVRAAQPVRAARMPVRPNVLFILRPDALRAQQQGQVPFSYDPALELFRGPEGNVLARTQRRRQHGQYVTVYRAVEPWVACPQRDACRSPKNAQHRTLKVAEEAKLLAAARQRFTEPAHHARYRHRGEQVETVFGFLRATLGYTRWLPRGACKVEAEAKLFKLAYQLRKVQRAVTG